jgi:small subunit ribosomal protein S2
MHYVNKRWLGGLLTNFGMIKKSIEKLIDLDEMKRDGRWEVKSKKEQSKLEKVYKKLHKNLWGMRNIDELPGVIIVIDSTFEDIAVYEARKLNIPLVAVVDTNANPEEINYPIPGNDDAIRSIRLFVNKFGEAVKNGMDQREDMQVIAEETGEESAQVDEGPIPEEESSTADSTEQPATEGVSEVIQASASEEESIVTKEEKKEVEEVTGQSVEKVKKREAKEPEEAPEVKEKKDLKTEEKVEKKKTKEPEKNVKQETEEPTEEKEK